MKLQKHYSGERSRNFWRVINGISDHDPKRWEKMYALGVKLQNLETKVLNELEKS